MAEQEFYIRLRGQVSGPFDLNELRRLKRLGMFTRVHEVSSDGVHWRSALKLFPSLLTRPGSTPPKPNPSIPDAKPSSPPPLPPMRHSPSIPPSDEEGERTGLRDRIRRLCLIESVCLTVLLLFCAFLPHTRQGGRLTWWWEEFLVGNWGLGLACIYAILVAIAILPVAVKAPALMRGWIFLVCATVGLLLLAVAPMTAQSPCVPLSVSVVGAGVLAALFAMLLARPWFPGRGRIAALRGIVGGVGGVLAVVAGSTAVVDLLGVRVGEARPAWAILGAVLVGIGWAAGCFAGGIGLLSIRVGMTAKRCKFGVVLAMVCLGLVALAGAEVGVGVAQQSEGQVEGARFLLVQFLRLLVSSYSLCVLLAVGILNVLLRTRPPSGGGARTANLHTDKG